MQIVIEIPEDDYNVYKAVPDYLCDADMLSIKNGTPLPKGHGRLIDADAVLEEPIGNTYKDIDIAETIIEADGGDKDINHAYNDCTRYDTLKYILDELQEPCADAISRANTIDEVSRIIFDHPLDGYEDGQLILKTIQDMPPVKSAEKVGKWIYRDEESNWNNNIYECSCCSRKIKIPYNLENIIQDYPYCNCGAKMQEVTDEID